MSARGDNGLGWLAALRHSWAGLRHALAHERPVRHEALALALAVPLAPFLASSALHAILLVGTLLLAIAVELLNVAIETVCDRLTTERDPAIKIAKDCGSAAVALTILLAALVWGEAAWRALGWALGRASG